MNIWQIFIKILLGTQLIVLQLNAADPLVADKQTEDGLPACSITITISGFEGGKCQFIGNYGGQNFHALPILDVEGEVIVIERDEPLPQGMYYLVLPGQETIIIFLDEDQQFSMTASLNGLAKSIEIEGSSENQLYYEILNYESSRRKALRNIQKKIKSATQNDEDLEPLNRERDRLTSDNIRYFEDLAVEHPNSLVVKYKLADLDTVLEYPLLENGELDKEKQYELFREAYWKNVDFNDGRLLRTPVFHKKLTRFVSKFTVQNLASLTESADFIIPRAAKNKELFTNLVGYFCLEYRKPKFIGGEGIFVHIVNNYLSDDYASWFPAEQVRTARIVAKQLTTSLPGKIGQDIRAKNLESVQESLYDLKSPIVIVYLYNIDCSHCQEQTPELQALYDEWKDKGVDVFAVSVNEDVEAWKAYVKKERLTFHNVIIPNYEDQVYPPYYIDVTPEVYVLDKDRRIVIKDLKVSQLESVLIKELAKVNNNENDPAGDTAENLSPR